ncbi:Hypothetical protein BAAA_1000044 [Brucella abortus str. 2308 A]|nr:Hypothetical protein BAAA_1000044 [Brucella abortus str. 2308 A]
MLRRPCSRKTGFANNWPDGPASRLYPPLSPQKPRGAPDISGALFYVPGRR